jgi:hypothetical protein
MSTFEALFSAMVCPLCVYVPFTFECYALSQYLVVLDASMEAVLYQESAIVTPTGQVGCAIPVLLALLGLIACNPFAELAVNCLQQLARHLEHARAMRGGVAITARKVRILQFSYILSIY